MPAAGTPVESQTTAAFSKAFSDGGSLVAPEGVLPGFVTVDNGTTCDLIVGFRDGTWVAVKDVYAADLVP